MDTQHRAPPWQCQGCYQHFGALRKYHTVRGWRTAYNNNTGRHEPAPARLCDHCAANHKHWQRWLPRLPRGEPIAR